jgi:hypothetical protein
MVSEFAGNRLHAAGVVEPEVASVAKPAEIIEVIQANRAPWLEAVLLNLYVSHFATLSRLKWTGELTDAVQAFLIREKGSVTCALLFRRQGRELHVLNEVAYISAAQIRRFTSHIFTWWIGIDTIRFSAIRTDLRQSEYSMRRHGVAEDFVLLLPRSIQEFFEGLPQASRKTIRKFSTRIKREFPSFAHRIYEGAQVRPEHIQQIVALNRIDATASGMLAWAGRKRRDVETETLIALARDCGQVAVSTIEGRICAGSISYRARDSFFLLVSSRDANLDGYRLHALNQYRAMTACIQAGAKECHLASGRKEDKVQFGGRPVTLESIALYRTRARAAFDAPHIMKNAAMALFRRAGAMATWQPA